MDGKSARSTLNRLYDIRNRFGREHALEKLALLEALPGMVVNTAAGTKKLHKTLCFMRAFPTSPDEHRLVTDMLNKFSARVTRLGENKARQMIDSGISASDVYYRFSCEVASWLARRYAGQTQVDWAEFERTERLDELLEHLLEPAEVDYFDGGRVSTEGWLEIASEHTGRTSFDWLMAQLRSRSRQQQFWTTMYNAADIPLHCRLANSNLSITKNLLRVTEVFYRTTEMQSRVLGVRKNIAQPVTTINKLEHKHGARMIDVAMASLAVRHRETLHFNYANPAEVYVADVGRGVQVVITGLRPEYRYPLETTMGFLLLSNGVPIGYGGASILYRQVNTGINIFEEYRGSEAAWLWVQVMRVFHTLTGCTRYIANPYQFGSENYEALQSGAFWFYYRLGYRPVTREIRRLAKREFARLTKSPRYRTPVKILRRLASCDMHLTLAGVRQEDYFDEAWIEESAHLATRRIAAGGTALSRHKARRQLAIRISRALRINSFRGWTVQERKWFSNLCPLIPEAELDTWPGKERRALVQLIRAKGSTSELDYARQARNHSRYFSALKSSCRRLRNQDFAEFRPPLN